MDVEVSTNKEDAFLKKKKQYIMWAHIRLIIRLSWIYRITKFFNAFCISYMRSALQSSWSVFEKCIFRSYLLEQKGYMCFKISTYMVRRPQCNTWWNEIMVSSNVDQTHNSWRLQDIVMDIAPCTLTLSLWGTSIAWFGKGRAKIHEYEDNSEGSNSE